MATFHDIIGQEQIKEHLQNAISAKKISHAYIINGEKSSGKEFIARVFAMTLQCEKGGTEPCQECHSCKQALSDNQPDIIYVSHEKPNTISVDDIRAQINNDIAIKPYSSPYKIYIMNEAEKMTPQAQNAILKTLEEPPAHAVFILATTDPQKVPATIQSRCQRFEFRRVTVDEIAEHLAMVAAGSGIEADADALRLIAVQAEGGMRDALSLLDQCGVMAKRVTVATVREVLGIVGREALHELTGAIGRRQLPQALATLNLLLEQGKDVKQVLTELIEYLRALVLYLAVPDYEEIYLTDTKEALAELAPLFGRDRLLAAEERLHSAIQELRGSMRPLSLIHI